MEQAASVEGPADVNMGKVFMDTPTRRQRRRNTADNGISGMPEGRGACRSKYIIQLPGTTNAARGTGQGQTVTA